VGWLGFLPEVLDGDSPDLRNAKAGLYERYGQAFSSSLKVRAIVISMCYQIFPKNLLSNLFQTFFLYVMWGVYALGMTRGVQKVLSNFFQNFFQNFLSIFVKFFSNIF